MSCAPKDLPKGPWRAVKLVFDSTMLFKMVTGESVVIEHRKLPADAMQIGCRANGTDTELIVQSETYNVSTCLCTMPVLRVNYSTGG